MSELIVYNSKYLNKDDTDDSLVSQIGKDNLKQYFIVHNRLGWNYLAFNSSSDYLVYRKSLLPEERCFHEQILGEEPQRIKFDIDAPKTYIERIPNNVLDLSQYGRDSKMENIILFIADMIVRTFNEEYTEELPYTPEVDNNILITESPGEDKYSYHIILIHFKLRNNIECKYFTSKVLKRLPEVLHDIVDRQVNKSVQSFRLLGSIKEGTTRCKVVSEVSPLVDNGFIQDLDDTDIVLAPKKDYLKEMKSQTYMPPDVLAAVVAKVYDKWPEFAQFRDERDRFLNFNRVAPSYCDFCERAHDSDHSLMIKWDRLGNGTYVVKYGCRRYVGERSMDILMEIKDKPFDKVRALNDIIDRLQSRVQDPTNRFERYGRHVTIRTEDNIQDIGNHAVSYIKAGMKMGKTKALIRYIKALDPSISICVLSFRLTFSQELHSKLPGFRLYNDIGGKIMSCSHKRLIIQIESLSRLSGEYDVLVLDESESILGQFSSGNVKNLTCAFATFERLVVKAKKVIAMDAYLSERTVDVLNYISGSEDYNIEYYTHQNATDYVYHVGYYKFNNHFLKELSKTLCQNVYDSPLRMYVLRLMDVPADNMKIIHEYMGPQYRGKNIAIITNSKREIDAIHRYILTENPSLGREDIEKYTSATDLSRKREHMKNIHKHWMKRVIIYTPTITAGLSFERKWFDQIFAYFSNNSCDVLSCMQMLGRIRNLGDKKITIAVDVKAINCSTSIEAIKRDIEYNRYNLLKSNCMANIMLEPPSEDRYQQDYQIVENNYWRLWVYNARNYNLSRKRFLMLLCDCILETGAKIAVFDMDKVGAEHQALMEIKKEIREETAKAMSIIALPNQEEIETIINKINEQEDLTPEEDLKFKKRRIQIIFDIKDEEKEVLDKIDFILQYNKPHVIEWYKNLKAMTLRPTIGESILAIKEIEAKRMSHIDNGIIKLEFKPTFQRHAATYSILNGVFQVDSFVGADNIDTKAVVQNIIKNKDSIRKAYRTHEMYPPSLITDDLEEDILMIIKNLNRIPYAMYGHKLVSEDKVKFILRNFTTFDINDEGVRVDLSEFMGTKPDGE